MMIFSFTRAGVLFKVLGRLCLRHRLANSCCVLNVVFVCCGCGCLHLASTANFAGTMVIGYA